MLVELLKNTSNTNSFTRNFTKNKGVEVVLKEGSDALNPSIVLKISNPTDYNMMLIPEFGDRYYFICWKNINNNLWEAYTKEIDVLYTYRNKILGLNAVIDKQEFRTNKLIDDGSYVSQVDTFPEVLEFTDGFDATENYILITA